MEESRRPDPGLHPEQDVVREQGDDEVVGAPGGRDAGDDVDAVETPEFQIHDA